MEAVTAGATGAQGTGSKTIADLLPLAVKKYGDRPAQRYKLGDEWVDASYNELGGAVREVALGLVDLGIQPSNKVSILAHTRPEWTHACFGILTAGGTLVTIYQTNSGGMPVRPRALRLARDLRGERGAAREGSRGRGQVSRARARDRHGRGGGEAGRCHHARPAARARPRP